MDYVLKSTIKEYFTKKFIIQKLDYINNDPCTGKWNLADCPEYYVYSSAGFYYKGLQGIYPVDNVINLMDIDLIVACFSHAESPCGRLDRDKDNSSDTAKILSNFKSS